MAMFRNYYRCDRCGHEWTDDWSATCDDDCPNCGASHMSPYKSEDVPSEEMDDEHSDDEGTEPALVRNVTERTARVRELNDAFRTTFAGGKVVMTSGVAELPDMVRANALLEVTRFDRFTPDNDPHGEHDFGNFDFCGRKFYWKIDYYDRALEFGSEDPSDPEKTTRVLTLMLAHEY